MKKKALGDLSKEEIGQLFPIEISEYNPNWPNIYEAEKQRIEKNITPTLFSRIEHFGSTSVPGLSSKNIIDILMAVEFESARNNDLIQQMSHIGYDSYHVHAAPQDHVLWNRIYFRNYLIKYPEVAIAYEELKRSLANKYKHDRVAYRIAKTEFINEYTQKSLLDK